MVMSIEPDKHWICTVGSFTNVACPVEREKEEDDYAMKLFPSLRRNTLFVS